MRIAELLVTNITSFMAGVGATTMWFRFRGYKLRKGDGEQQTG
jgi:hypothetical protein